MSLFGALTKVVAKGLMNTLDNPIGAPIAKSLAANAQNDLKANLFYSTNPIKRGAGMGLGLSKTIGSSVLEQLDPRLLAMREVEGIGHRTKKTIDTELGKLDEIKSDMKSADVFRPNKELTADEIKVKKEYLNQEKGPSKTIMGQLLWQQLQSKQQNTPSKILDEGLLSENFLANGMLIDAKGNINVEEFVNIKNFKGWETEYVLGEGRMKTMLEKILAVNDSAIPKGKKLQYFVRQDSASDASANLVFEMQKGPRTRAINNILKKHNKIFNTPEEMAAFLTKELTDNPEHFVSRTVKNKLGIPKYRKDRNGNRVEVKEKVPLGVGGSFEVRDGAVWFDDSFKSSDFSLGGVNVMNFIQPDGTKGSMLSDINDIAGLAMPAGDNAITLSLPKVSNVYVKKDHNKSQAVYNKKVEETIERMGGKTFNQRAKRIEEPMQIKALEEKKASVEAIIPPTAKMDNRVTRGNETQAPRLLYDKAYEQLMKDYRAGTMSVAQTKVARDIQDLNYKFEDLTMRDWMKYLAKVGVVSGALTLMRGEE